MVEIAGAQDRVNITAISKLTGVGRKAVRRILAIHAEKEKGAPREGGAQSIEGEMREENTPHGSGAASPAEGGNE